MIQFAHARIGDGKQARPPLERGVERLARPLKERSLAGASKMAAPSADYRHFPVREDRLSGAPVRLDALECSKESEVVVISDEEEEVQLGEQTELTDSSGALFTGTVCGEASNAGSKGRAFVSLDFWQQDSGEGPSWCDTSHAYSGHGVQARHW
ncbi:hypothetical protein NDU88_005569 [Pleurodeles waltl]|uniref:Uncharacterized protein n=1 Tax=Pleurodeles waltl TaxID=8319 RepID=A0AAV7LPI4_PLEWA|nr:hypothetical protein NDU88_005569 [Pleurodeles waltl]